jgi:hypothetical protein
LVLGKDKEEYKLDYYLYVRCNDNNKELISLLASDNYIGSIIDNGGRKNSCISKEEELELQEYIIGLMKLDKLFKYKGFSIMHSTKFDSTTLLNIDEYINNISNILHECVKYINKEKLYIEFIEFKKSSLMMITLVNNTSNEVGPQGGLKLSASIYPNQKRSYHTSNTKHGNTFIHRLFVYSFSIHYFSVVSGPNIVNKVNRPKHRFVRSPFNFILNIKGRSYFTLRSLVVVPVKICKHYFLQYILFNNFSSLYHSLMIAQFEIIL